MCKRPNMFHALASKEFLSIFRPLLCSAASRYLQASRTTIDKSFCSSSQHFDLGTEVAYTVKKWPYIYIYIHIYWPVIPNLTMDCEQVWIATTCNKYPYDSYAVVLCSCSGYQFPPRGHTSQTVSQINAQAWQESLSGTTHVQTLFNIPHSEVHCLDPNHTWRQQLSWCALRICEGSGPDCYLYQQKDNAFRVDSRIWPFL